MVKKFTIILTMLLALLAAPLAANATMALQWDAYSDPTATKLVLESSLNNSTWVVLTDDIATSAVGVGVPDHTTDDERVYYRLRASDGTNFSDSSNVVSYYWTTGGGGQEGLQKPNDINFVDCTNTTDPDEIDFCTALGL